jgi:hypothetical protein
MSGSCDLWSAIRGLRFENWFSCPGQSYIYYSFIQIFMNLLRQCKAYNPNHDAINIQSKLIKNSWLCETKNVGF